jgi:hypothetical protein
MALLGMECGFSQSQFRARRHENGGLTPSGGGSQEASPLITRYLPSNTSGQSLDRSVAPHVIARRPLAAVAIQAGTERPALECFRLRSRSYFGEVGSGRGPSQ